MLDGVEIVQKGKFQLPSKRIHRQAVNE